ncbi:hypothetical protein [Pseudothauera hydrothermalis]|uniref:hypothetical protein n=1 Tax=Pseudothauera hydrothermalis TaxID=2184083 RepID=UPI0013C360F2|nr:hypothetical protein [Pseudothauera hydrothermalis]
MPSTTLTQFRDQYVDRVKQRLLAANVASASDTDLILQSALYKALDAVNRIDVIGPDALALLAGMSGAELEAWLGDIANRQAFEAVVASSTAMQAVLASTSAWSAVVASSTAMQAVAASSTAMQAVASSSTAMQAVAASSTTMQAVAASSTAMQAVASSSTAMQAVAASSTAMQAVWASDVAADAVLTSSTAKNAVWESDTALTALQANPAQIARQIGISGRVQYASTSSQSVTLVTQGTRVILLRRWYSNNENDYLRWSRTNGNLATPSVRGLYGVYGYGTQTGSYAINGVYCNSESDAANLVCACNGLRRDTWSNNQTLYVRYITV